MFKVYLPHNVLTSSGGQQFSHSGGEVQSKPQSPSSFLGAHVIADIRASVHWKHSQLMSV